MANDYVGSWSNPYFSNSSPVTNRTLSVTVPGGLSNSKMLVFAGATNGPISGVGHPAISSFTLNSNAMSSVGNTGGSAQYNKAFLYEYDDPASGTYNASVTFTQIQDGVILTAVLFEDTDENFYRDTVFTRATTGLPGYVQMVNESAIDGDQVFTFFVGDDDGAGALGDVVFVTTPDTELFTYDGYDLSNYYAGTLVQTKASGSHTESIRVTDGVANSYNGISIAVGSGSSVPATFIPIASYHYNFHLRSH